MGIIKVCSACKTSLGLSAFSKDKRKENGLRSNCKGCDKAYYDVNKDKITERKKAYFDSNKDKITEYNRAYQKAYDQANRDKIKERKKAHRYANKDKITESKKAYYYANKDKIAEIRKEYFDANRDKITLQVTSYRKANPAKFNAANAKRRAAKLNATPSWLTKEDYNQMQVFYTEAQQLTLSTGVQHHVDHIYPLQGETVCGLHVPSNLQVLTATENMGKSNKFTASD